MKMPFSRRRMTAYQSVVASSVPLIRCHGRGGSPAGSQIPASINRLRVAT